MIRTKNTSVDIANLHPKLKAFLEDMSSMFDGIVVTSGNDGIHMPTSRHYLDKGIDIGAKSSNAAAYSRFRDYVLANKSRLKQQYQLEDIINEGSHIHIEMPLTVEEVKIVEKRKNMSVIAVILLVSIGFTIYYKWVSREIIIKKK